MKFWTYFRSKRGLSLAFVSVASLAAVTAAACSGSSNAASPYAGAMSTPASSTSAAATYSMASPAASAAATPASGVAVGTASPLTMTTANGDVGARPDTASTAEVNVSGTGASARLVGPNGLTLYVFAKDTAGTSNCAGQCLQSWPALTVPADLRPTAADGVTGVVAFLTRADNSARQITYNGRPLYFFAGDSLPGDTRGDGIGGVWSIARP